MAQSSDNLRVAALLFALCCLAYGGAVKNGLVADDHVLVASAPLWSDWRNAPRLFTSPLPHTLAGAFVYYRPVVSLSFLADYQLWGLELGAFRLTNIVLHAANGALVYAVTKALFASGSAALLAALIFAAHPLHAEVVDHVYNRAEALATLFRLLTCLLFVRSRETTGPRSTALYIGSLAGLVAALLSKESGVTLPLVILAIEVWGPRGRGPLPALLARHAPFWALAGLYLALRATVLFRVSVELPRSLDALAALWQVTRGLTLYLHLVCFPVRLYLEYPLTRIGGSEAAFALVLALTAGGVLCAALSRDGMRRLWLALVWLLAALLPLVPTSINRATVDADRYLYAPYSCLVFIAGLALGECVGVRGSRPKRTLLVALTLGLALSGSILASRQTRFWENEVTQWTRKFSGSPQDLRIQSSLNAALFAAGHPQRAVIRMERLAAKHPEDLRARLNLGLAWLRLGAWGAALPHLEWAAQAQPTKVDALLGLATASLALRQNERAESLLRAVLARDPFHAPAHQLLARLYESTRRTGEAAEHYQALLQVERDPTRRAALRQKLDSLHIKKPAAEEATPARPPSSP